MKIVRYLFEQRGHYGALEQDVIVPLEGPLHELHPVAGAASLLAKRASLLAPVMPGKIVAVGVNYRDHATEMGRQLPPEPMLFIKPSTAVIGPDDPIVYPPQSTRVDYEGELAIVISRTARKVSASDARAYVLGYTCLNDVTARDLQTRDTQYTRAKGFDSFAPIGPAIVTDIDPGDLSIVTRLNGEVRQQSRTSQLIFGCDDLLSYVSHIMTLMPGDVLSTGTPSGVGPMKAGDVVEVEIERIGCLRNSVAAPR